jgi:hypothetical protein
MKKSQNSKNQAFSSVFCLLMEGVGSGAGSVKINYPVPVPRVLDPEEAQKHTVQIYGSES